MKKNIRYDDDLDEYSTIALQDEKEEEDAMQGFAVVGEDGQELENSNKTDNDDISSFVNDNEITIASEIPKDEQTVIFDNAKISGIKEGTALTLVLSDTSGELVHNDKVVGNLKPAFVAKLKIERANQYVICSLKSTKAPFFVLLKYSSKKIKNATKI